MIKEILVDQLKGCDVRIEKCERAVAILEKRELALRASKAEREYMMAMLDT